MRMRQLCIFITFIPGFRRQRQADPLQDQALPIWRVLSRQGNTLNYLFNKTNPKPTYNIKPMQPCIVGKSALVEQRR